MLPPWAVGTRGPDQSGIPRKSTAIDAVRWEGSSTIGGLVGAGKDAASVANSLGRTYLETVTGMGDDERAAPFRAPRSIFNGRIHTPRRYATQSYSIDRLKNVAKAADGSLNDVFLAITGGALRTYLLVLFNGQALNVTAVSYDGMFNVGYTGCRDSIPSLQRIAVHSGEELDKLEAALGITT